MDKATKSAKPTRQQSPKKVQKKPNNFKASQKSKPNGEGGPGMYDPDTATKLTKSRAGSAMMGKQGRPDLNKRVQHGTGDLGPGAYDGGK